MLLWKGFGKQRLIENDYFTSQRDKENI